jgi:hypothetical protein
MEIPGVWFRVNALGGGYCLWGSCPLDFSGSVMVSSWLSVFDFCHLVPGERVIIKEFENSTLNGIL